MIRTIIRPFINVNRNQIIYSAFIKNNFDLSFAKCYSELSPKTEVVHESIKNSNSIELKPKNETNTSLLINEDFIKMLDQKLDPKNYKSLAYKQDEINKIIYKLENPFHLFYLYEKHSNDLTSYNLINVIKKMAYFSRNRQLINDNGDFLMPEKIKKLLTKQIIKQVSHFEPFQCFILIQKLYHIGFKLDDFSVKAAMQILKYHVNELDLNEIIQCKILLNKFIADKSSNEYSENLQKALDLVVQVKYEDLKNANQAISLLNNFLDSISDANFEKIVDFIFENLNKTDINELVDLSKILAQRNFMHLKLLTKIKKYVIKSNTDDFNMLKQLHDTFFQLKFYDSNFEDFYMQKQLSHLKTIQKIDHEICSGLLKSLIFFRHKNLDLLEFLNEKKYFCDENFPLYEFMYYSSLTNYEKIDDWNNLVENFLSKSYDDEEKMQIVESLCWIKKAALAKKVFDSIETPHNLNIVHKLFAKDVFELNFFNIDEKLPGKTKLEENIEICINQLKDYEINWFNTNLDNTSYFKNFEILNISKNKKCLVQISGVNERFRNVSEFTNSFKFRSEYLKNLTKKDGDSHCYFWIIESKKLQNINQEQLLDRIKNKLNDLFEEQLKL